MSVRTVQEHSEPVDGTFTLTLDGIPLKIYNYTSLKYEVSDIPAQSESWRLKGAFKTIGFENIEVETEF